MVSREPGASRVSPYITFLCSNTNMYSSRSQSVPELPTTRENFDQTYDLRADGPSTWRNEFHSPVLTMGNRGNHFVCHPYEIPLHEKERPSEDEQVLEYIKSIIKVIRLPSPLIPRVSKLTWISGQHHYRRYRVWPQKSIRNTALVSGTPCRRSFLHAYHQQNNCTQERQD